MVKKFKKGSKKIILKLTSQLQPAQQPAQLEPLFWPCFSVDELLPLPSFWFLYPFVQSWGYCRTLIFPGVSLVEYCSALADIQDFWCTIMSRILFYCIIFAAKTSQDIKKGLYTCIYSVYYVVFTHNYLTIQLII